MNTNWNCAICLDCGFIEDVNYFNPDVATEADPNPILTCPKCGGLAEFWDEQKIYPFDHETI